MICSKIINRGEEVRLIARLEFINNYNISLSLAINNNIIYKSPYRININFAITRNARKYIY